MASRESPRLRAGREPAHSDLIGARLRISRRVFLSGCGVAAGGIWLLRDPPSIEGQVRPDDLDVVRVESMPADGRPALDFFALGDIGTDTPARAAVLQQMIATVPSAAPAFVALLGDNFYLDGVESTEDPRWKTDFELCFREPELEVPFFAALGNHDYNGSVAAQVAYTQLSRRWKMPARYYSFERRIGSTGHRAAFFVLDTTLFQRSWSEERRQTEWLATALAECRATWRIVIGHHPMLSHGKHGGSSGIAAALAPLFKRYGVHFYLSGHDHDLQLVRSNAGWCQIVSGAGSSTRETGSGLGTAFSLAQPGFAWLRLTSEDAHVQFITAVAGSRRTFRLDRGTLVDQRGT